MTLRILIVTRSYPAPGDLYQYPFVHRRVLAYQAAGLDVAVFRPSIGEAATYRFDGVECTTGDRRRLETLAARFRPDVLGIHGVGATTWDSVAPLAGTLPSAVWLHGSEIPGFLRRKSLLDGASRRSADDLAEQCSAFWRDVLAQSSGPARLVFPSETALRYMMDSVDVPAGRRAIIPNPIDTDLFGYETKRVDQRFHVLLIRPFDSRCYANDLAVEAICKLQHRSEADRFHFRLFGDGPLFSEAVKPLRSLANVAVHRGFLTQAEIAREHKLSGIFLVPTRLDTQGVSRDEAMSSGLVPVTNAIDPLPEFVGPDCARRVPPDDPDAIASALLRLANSPDSFLRKSSAAARRIRSTRSSQRVLPMDLNMLRGLSQQ
jgi:glycosyltransferase involved in cell wall biosynthesis